MTRNFWDTGGMKGPQWLRLSRCGIADAGVQAITCETYLQQHAPGEPLTLPEGSWGEGAITHLAQP